MKKIFLFLTILLSSFFCISYAEALTYSEGIIKTSSSIYKSAEASSKNRLINDTGGIIALYSPEAVEIIGEEGNFYEIKFLYTGFLYTGYISKSNVIKNDYEISEEYEHTLREQGFPTDYIEKLAILHAIHPNWTFTASYTGNVEGGLDFNEVVEAEAEVVSRNLIDSPNTSLRSTADGAYLNGVWIGLSGSNWFAASKQTIGFFLDPRNFFDESHIFMFENLGYNEASQTSEVVNKVISSSFMNNPFSCLEGAFLCELGSHTYTDTFMRAGIDKRVSPVHLATRVIQEQGSNGSVLSLGLGYKNKYIGFYNFFNIGASGKTDEEVITNGLKYAANRNWNNQYASIYDRPSTIASNYIAIGQSTLYYQKFNTIAMNYGYSHQYMQNVRAPYQESYNTYSNYYRSYPTQEEWNNAYYDFLIPIYKNFNGTTTLETSGNADATLKSLNVTSCKLNPDFQSSAYEYECYISKEIDKVNVEAITTNEKSTALYEQNVDLTEDLTEITIEVTAQAGNKSLYKINIRKIESDGYTPSEILNGIGIKVSDTTASNFELGMDVSNIINSVLNKHHFTTISVLDSNLSEIKDGIVKTGLNITIKNNGAQEVYKTVVFGDTSGDGVIDIRDLLIIQKHLVKAKILTDEYLTASDINKDGTIDIRDLLLEQKYLLNQYSISQS